MVKVYVSNHNLRVGDESLTQGQIKIMQSENGDFYLIDNITKQSFILGSYDNIEDANGGTFGNEGEAHKYLDGVVNKIIMSSTDGSDTVTPEDLTRLIKMYGEDGRVRFDDNLKHFFFEVKQPDGQWLQKAEIGGSLIIDTVKFEESSEKPIVKSNELGLYSKTVTVPDHYGASTTHQALRPFFVLETGQETPLVGVWEDELRIPMTDGSNEYAAFKSELIPILKELKRLTPHTGVSGDNIFTYSGAVAPDLPETYSGYYVTMYNMQTPQHITLPSNAAEGVIVSIDNQQENSAGNTPVLTFGNEIGGTIDGTHVDDESIPLNTIVFLVKTSSGWVTGFSGVIPKTLDTITNAIKTKLVGQLHTIDDVSAALKDRLHTFAALRKEGFIEGIRVGKGYGDYDSAIIKDISIHAPMYATFDKPNKSVGLSIDPDALGGDTKAIEDELARLKSDLTQATETIFTYRGKVQPSNMDSTKHKAYYISMYGLIDNSFVFQMPQPVDTLEDGAIFCIDNNDAENFFMLNPPSGQTINNKSTQLKIRPSSIAFLVKTGTDWNVAFSGYIPPNLDTIIQAVKTKVGANGLTIDQVQAQLKDRLHTFREIQTEFDDQLHTYNDIEAELRNRGYNTGMSAEWALSDTNSIDPQTFTGAIIEPNQQITTATSIGDKYLVFMLSKELFELTDGYVIDGVVKEFETTKFIKNARRYDLLISTDTLDSTQQHTIHLNLSVDNTAPGGITIDDGTTNKAGVKQINLEGAKISKVFDDSPEVTLTNGVDIHMMAPNQQYGNALANEITILPPLNVYDDASVIGKDNSVKLELMPGTFAPVGAPGFLGYIAEDTEVVGKLGTDEAHHKGALWFDDVIVPTGTYLQSDRVNKAYGIQDYSNDDPNVTGGVNFLIAFRAGLKGKAPNDGKIRIALVKKNMSAFDDGIGYLEDVNGQPMAVEKHYKTGDELGTLEVVGVVNAKGLQEFQAIIADNFSSDLVVLLDRTENGTGLMIQSIGHDATHSDQKGKTGDALQQFELDTMQNIEFSSHYLGVDRMTMGWVNSRPDSVKSYTAGTHFISVDGWRLINPGGIKVGVVDGHTQIQDDGVHIAEFNWGKIFSAEETQMLRGHTIDVSTTLVDKDSGYEIALVKWTGKPDAYTPEIFTSRNNGSPILQANWTKVDSFFISEDAVSGDHTKAKTMTVPSDANNYAIIIYPVTAESPMTLKLKELKVDVNPAFTGYAIHYPELAGNLHLEFDPEYKEFRQDNQGYASLRYTLNNTPASGLPMPCGEDKNGRADIEIDTTVNQVSGSAARGGEGAIKFNEDGEVTIQTELLLWNEQISTSTTTFWWSTVSPDGNTFTKIADSETTFEVPTGSVPSKFSMKPFKLAVENGDRIALRGLTDSVDGAFLESKSPSAPMVTTKIQFKELTTGDSGDTPQDMVLQSDLSDDFSVDVDTNQVTIPQLGDLSDRVDEIDLEIVVTDRAKAAGWYIELDYNPDTERPSLSPKQRNP